MVEPNDPLARLRAERRTVLLESELHGYRGTVWLRQRCAAAREFGRRAAVERLTWREIDTFRDWLERARCGDQYMGSGPATIIELVAGRSVALASGVACFGEWIAYLEGVDEVARAVEAAG